MGDEKENSLEMIEWKGEDISPDHDQCLLKEIVRQGENDGPYFDDRVSINFLGKTLDGIEFERSDERKGKYEFNLGRGEVIKAWDIAIQTMKRGEIAQILSKPKFAYGLKGYKDKVPAATSVLFIIELIDFHGKDLSCERDQSIIRRIIERGNGGENAIEDSIVQIEIEGFYQGNLFDQRNVEFILGMGCLQNIPPSVEILVYRMIENEKSKLTLKSSGLKGLEEFQIPPDGTVDYFVTMKKLKRAKEERNLNDQQKLEESQIFKERADRLVKAGFYELAVKRYQTVVNYLLNASLREEKDLEKSRQLKFSSQSNLALCYLKLKDYQLCKRSCQSALIFEPDNEKVLFRRGQAQLATHNYDQALEDFHKILQLNPSNLAAKQQIEECFHQMKLHRLQEKQTYHSIFIKDKQKNLQSKLN